MDKFEELKKYQEEQIDKIREYVFAQLGHSERSYAVETYLCRKDETDKFSDQLSVLKEAGHDKEISWGKGKIGAVWCLHAESMEGHIFPAEVITNYGVYPVRVILHAEKEAHRAAEHINQLYTENGIDMPCVNEAQIRGFFDVEFYETEDELREDEQIIDVQIAWGTETGNIFEDVALLWNVRPVLCKECKFPVPEDEQVMYRHEIQIHSCKNGYLADTDTVQPVTVHTTKDRLFLMTAQRTYQAWKIYEIVKTETGLKEQLHYPVSNGIRESIFSLHQKTLRHVTSAEIMRNIWSYEASDYFKEIRYMAMDRIYFYPKAPDNPWNADMMNFIIHDLRIVYGTECFYGCLRKEVEE